MGEEKRIKGIMVPIEEYDRVGAEEHLCDAVSILKRNYESIKANPTKRFHNTLLVIDAADDIIGLLSSYSLIRGLVPEEAKQPETGRAFHRVLTSRARDVARDVAEFQNQFKWLHSSFVDLVKQEAHKKVKDIMSPIHPILSEDDTINRALYLMFKEDVRQPLVVREGRIVGVINLMEILNELLEIAGPECYVTWEDE
jgi:CBS domain-containing protein